MFSHSFEGNSFLIHSDKITLVDLGSVAIAKQLPIHQIKFIILTHMHYDHTGGLGYLQSAAKIMMHAADANLIGTEATASHFFGNEPSNFDVDVKLHDGDEIDIGNFTLRVIHTPGHTPGSICLFESTSKSLFSGDTIFPYGGIGRTDLVGGNSGALVESIKKLMKLDVRVLYPGHGPITGRDAKQQMMQSLSLAQAIHAQNAD